MLNKSVFLGYIAAAAAVVAAFVLILIMLHQDRQYERRKLLSLVGVLAGSICMNTMYFLSFFDALTSLSVLYAPIERCTDILFSLVINLFLLLYLYNEAKDTGGLAGRLFKPALFVLLGGFLFGGIIYLTVVTDNYGVSSGHLLLAEAGQFVMTAAICFVTAIYTWLAVRCDKGRAAGTDDPQRKTLRRLIIGMGVVNIITAIYNAAGSIAMFLHQFDYVDWGGANDMNTWLFILSDVLVLLVVICYYRRQMDQMEARAVQHSAGISSAALNPADTAADASSQTSAIIPAELGLTPREEEIAGLILQRQTYREIAEQLTISEHTVKRHVHNIYEKAGVSRRDELIRKISQETTE